jgi:hypothetical protein
MRVTLGLWPMPSRSALQPVIARRVHDMLAVIAWSKHNSLASTGIDVVG